MQNTRWLTEIKNMLISPAPGIEEGCFARDDPANETYDLMIQIDPSHARVILILFSNSLNDSIFPIDRPSAASPLDSPRTRENSISIIV